MFVSLKFHVLQTPEATFGNRSCGRWVESGSVDLSPWVLGPSWMIMLQFMLTSMLESCFFVGLSVKEAAQRVIQEFFKTHCKCVRERDWQELTSSETWWEFSCCFLWLHPSCASWWYNGRWCELKLLWVSVSSREQPWEKAFGDFICTPNFLLLGTVLSNSVYTSVVCSVVVQSPLLPLTNTKGLELAIRTGNSAIWGSPAIPLVF